MEGRSVLEGDSSYNLRLRLEILGVGWVVGVSSTHTACRQLLCLCDTHSTRMLLKVAHAWPNGHNIGTAALGFSSLTEYDHQWFKAAQYW